MLENAGPSAGVTQFETFGKGLLVVGNVVYFISGVEGGTDGQAINAAHEPLQESAPIQDEVYAAIARFVGAETA